jgi:predicted metalloprotease with PDZ domain
VAALLCLAIMNMSARATWTEMEDGVLWTSTGADIVAKEVAPGSPGERAGIRVGDLLLAIDG